jgi:hypothetical protein
VLLSEVPPEEQASAWRAAGRLAFFEVRPILYRHSSQAHSIGGDDGSTEKAGDVKKKTVGGARQIPQGFQAGARKGDKAVYRQAGVKKAFGKAQAHQSKEGFAETRAAARRSNGRNHHHRCH